MMYISNICVLSQVEEIFSMAYVLVVTVLPPTVLVEVLVIIELPCENLRGREGGREGGRDEQGS